MAASSYLVDFCLRHTLLFPFLHACVDGLKRERERERQRERERHTERERERDRAEQSRE
jgi:hypothetical protein